MRTVNMRTAKRFELERFNEAKARSSNTNRFSRKNRIVLTESDLRRTLRLLIENAQVDSFVDNVVGRNRDPREWLESEERSMWLQVVDTLSVGLKGKSQEILHALKLLWKKRSSTNEPLEDYLVHDCEAIVEMSSSIATVKAKSEGKINSIMDVASISEIHETLENYVRAPSFKLAVPDPLVTISGTKTWDIYLPLNPGESCAIAKLGDPKVTWCTAREINNMFYGYASEPVWLYYIVESENPINKYSIGVNGKTKKIMPSKENHTTVDSRNREFKFVNAFGSDSKKITNFINSHSKNNFESTHPGLQDIYRASRSLSAWRTFMKNQSSDADYLYNTLQALQKKPNGFSNDVYVDMLFSMAKKVDKIDRQNVGGDYLYKRIVSLINMNLLSEADSLKPFKDQILKILPNLSEETRNLFQSSLDSYVSKTAEENRLKSNVLYTALNDWESWSAKKDELLNDNFGYLNDLLRRKALRSEKIDFSILFDLVLSLIKPENIEQVEKISRSAIPFLYSPIIRNTDKQSSSLLMKEMFNTLMHLNVEQKLGTNLAGIFYRIVNDHLHGLTPENELKIKRLGSRMPEEAEGATRNPQTVSEFISYINYQLFRNPITKEDFDKTANEAFAELVALNGSDGLDFEEWRKKYSYLIFGPSGKLKFKSFITPKVTKKFLSEFSFEQKVKVIMKNYETHDSKLFSKMKKINLFEELMNRDEMQGLSPSESAKAMIRRYLALVFKQNLGISNFDLGPNLENLPDVDNHRDLRYTFEDMQKQVFELAKLKPEGNQTVVELQNRVSALQPVFQRKIEEMKRSIRVREAIHRIRESRLSLPSSTLRQIIAKMPLGTRSIDGRQYLPVQPEIQAQRLRLNVTDLKEIIHRAVMEMQL